MTSLPQGPTATQLHARTLTEEEEPRTNKPGGLAVPVYGPSSSASACDLPEARQCQKCDWDASFHPLEITHCLYCGTELPT